MSGRCVSVRIGPALRLDARFFVWLCLLCAFCTITPYLLVLSLAAACLATAPPRCCSVCALVPLFLFQAELKRAPLFLLPCKRPCPLLCVATPICRSPRILPPQFDGPFFAMLYASSPFLSSTVC